MSLVPGAGAEHDVVIQHRVVHREYVELVGQANADPAERSAAQQDVTLGLVDDP